MRLYEKIFGPNILVPWDTLGVPQGPPGQTDASQKGSPGDSGSHYGLVTHWDSPVDGAFLPLLRTSPDICVCYHAFVYFTGQK